MKRTHLWTTLFVYGCWAGLLGAAAGCSDGDGDVADVDVGTPYAIGGPATLQVSFAANRSALIPLIGAHVPGTAYVFLSGGTSTIARVAFYQVDSATTVRHTEYYAPYD